MDARNVSTKRQPAEDTDQVLVEQSKQGDPDAMAKLIRRHYGASVRMANSIQPGLPEVAHVSGRGSFQYLDHQHRRQPEPLTPPRQAPCYPAQLGGTDERADQVIPYISRTDAGGKHRPA